MAITQKEIFDFLDERDPDTKMTLREMRSLLGGGSLETISRAVRAYRQVKSEKQIDEMPNAFSQLFEKFAREVWNQAAEQAKEAALKTQASCEETISKLEATVTDLDKRLANSHAENDKLKAKVASLTEELAKQKTLLGVAEERALEFAGERDAARDEVKNLQKVLNAEQIARTAAEASLSAYKEALSHPELIVSKSCSKSES